MGKTSKFFLSLFGFKTKDPPTSRGEHNKQLKRRWSFVNSRRENSSLPRIRETSNSLDGTSFHLYERNLNKNEDPKKQAIALAAATAAVVDAAVAAAHAAKEVVRMTSTSTSTSRTTGYSGRDKLAAIKIQSCFRAYLARRALRALKALVRLQAVVRGHILRKQTADMMRRLQALIRAQARARALRSQFSDPTTNNKLSSHFYHYGPPTPEKFEHLPHTKQDHRPISKRNGSKSYGRGIINQDRTIFDGSTDHEYDKIVEVDTGEQYHVMTKGRKVYQPDQVNFGYGHSITTSRGSTFQPTSSSPCASCEVNSFDDSLRGGVSTPIKSDGPRSCISGYSDHPNYMANTESSRAKVRSLSAPRLRPQLEIISNATKKDFSYKYGSGMPRVPTMRDSFAKKAYPGSGRLDRLGMPVYDTEESEFCVSYWN